MTTATRAAQEVQDIAQRLRDPDHVRAVMAAQDAATPPPGGEPVATWSPTSLASGYPALALFYGELARHDSAYRGTTHRYLGLAVDALRRAPHHNGLYSGFGAVAFAAECAAHGTSDYTSLRGTLRTSLGSAARTALARETRRLDDGVPADGFRAWDLITGLTGLGCCLLTQGDPDTEALHGVLTALVRLTDPLVVDGTPFPGWWVTSQPSSVPQPAFRGGHANLGLAHGILGPLALLSLAWEQGHRVARQEEAVHTVMEFFAQAEERDEEGPYWPRCLPRTRFTASAAGPPTVATTASPLPGPSWCYGTPSLAHTFHLAARAFARPDWSARAGEALRAMLRRPHEAGAVIEPGLCHGWSGIEHVMRCLHTHSPDPEVAEAANAAGACLRAARDPEAPFLYPVPNPRLGRSYHLPGFLGGTAGIGLALLAGENAQRAHTPWQRALLLG
ncbi:lanthionine synthetase C family protein [Streptomyces sp. cg36]|uniref:lanthionine synthetase C family protein n=1 Tax=Streptomyces sp. cg36 TaxID=3238798 RepID=UPI0034E235C0